MKQLKAIVDSLLVILSFFGVGIAIGSKHGLLAVPCVIIGVYCYIQLDRAVIAG